MKVFRQIAAWFLTIIILMPATGFSMNAHFCAGQLQDFSFFVKAQKCEMEMPAKPPCHKASHAVDLPSCCDDASFSSDLADVVPMNKAAEQTVNAVKLVAVFTLFFTNKLIQPNAHLADNHTLYLPPLIHRDIPVLVQSFLI